ncbi:decapping and exoribonuclease protein [Pelodiscus sinensis]|uniref:decapping and exoribonuclease protein n=1 Tax=Pelodiscus sinensis TaxID=13735 RepID=UPI003F6C2FB8
MEPGARPAKRSSREVAQEPGASPKRGRWAPPRCPRSRPSTTGPSPSTASQPSWGASPGRRAPLPPRRPPAALLRPAPRRPPRPPLRPAPRLPGRYVRRDEDQREGLEHLLRWVAGQRDRLRLRATPRGARERQGTRGWSIPLPGPPLIWGWRRPVNADFITWRGHLTKVLTTPYENHEGWLLAVSLFRGTLYVSEVETPAARQQREQRSDMLQELAYMGYKFEHYMCADTPDGSPDPTGVVNTNEAFCTVVRTRLGPHSLLFAGEVDCTDPHGPSPPACYVELKTCKEMHSQAQRRIFYRHKLIKWWAQSFLPGVSRIVAGFRAPDGTVASLETFQTMNIFPLIRGEQGCWKPAVCMNFCEAFLAFLKRVVTEDDPQLVHLFAWEPGHPVSCTRHRGAEHVFLPAWYVEAWAAAAAQPEHQ